MVDDAFVQALKWVVFGNAIFMLIWLGLRITFVPEPDWILLDAALAVGSLLIADRYHTEEL